MILSPLSIIETNQRIRLSCRVTWEVCDQESREIFFETEKIFGDNLSLNPDAFLVGTLIPALHFGEKRIVMTEAVCPYLKEGLETVMAIMQLWSQGVMQPLRIDTPVRAKPLIQERKRRAAMVLSGGIDSLATLRLNRRDYPLTHSAAIKDAIIIHGFDIGGVVERGMKYHVFERALEAMKIVAGDTGLTLIPLYTNIRHLCDDRVLWLDYLFGAVLAAAGHALSSRINLLYLASSFDLPNLTPCGSHPLLDPEYSSYDFRIRHSHAGLSRLEKIKIVSGWDAAFHHFRVCLANLPDQLNCGRCEKCVRTMLGLEALNLLDQTEAFEEDRVAPDRLAAFKITIEVNPSDCTK